MVEIMAVDRPEIIEIKGLEKHAGRNKGFERFFAAFGPVIDIVSNSGQGFEEFTEILAPGLQSLTGKGSAEQ
jgi:hypothetical protein